DGNRIVTGGIDQTARVWDATPLPPEVLRAHDARIEQKQALLEQLRAKLDPEQRAEFLALAGQWAEGAVALAEAVEQSPQNINFQYHRFLSVLRPGDKGAYRRIAAENLARYGPGAPWVAWACSLAPDVVADHDVPVRGAEATLERASADWKPFAP